MATISYAGYGCYNRTSEATGPVQQQYNQGERTFLANNNWVGDPAPGLRKYLYIVWQQDNQTFSGVTGENDGNGIVVP